MLDDIKDDMTEDKKIQQNTAMPVADVMSQADKTQEQSTDTLEEEKELDSSSYTIDADFDEDEEKAVISLIESELNRTKRLYDERDLTTKNSNADDEYSGTHDIPEDIDNMSDYDVKLLLTTVTIDIIASRAYRQTWSPNSCIQMEAEFEDAQDVNDILNKRVNYLDYYLRNINKLQDISVPIYRNAGKYGYQIVKTCYDNVSENFTQKKFYRPTQGDIAKFENKYKKKMLNQKSKEFKEWQTLNRKMSQGDTTPIVKKETDDIVVFRGAISRLIDWRNFFARSDIKDFRKHTCISEYFSWNWYDIESKIAEGFWDADKVEKFIAQYKKEKSDASQDDYLKKDFDFYESVVLFDRTGEGKRDRYIVTHEAKTKTIVRAIYYPYRHIFYTSYNLFDESDSWISFSITERMSDIIAVANSCITSFVKEQDMAHTPLIISNGKKASDWSINVGVPNLLQVDPSGATQNSFMQYRLESVSTDRISFLEWIIRYIALLTGVDPILLTGGTDPADKRASTQKVAMKFQASGLRVEDMIIVLQKGDADVAKQVEDIIYRFADTDKNGKTDISFFKNGHKIGIDSSFFERSVRYMMSGSRMSFDKSLDLQAVMQTWDFVAQHVPEVLMNLQAKKAFFTALINNSQGTVEKMKDTLVKPIDDEIDAAKKEQEKLKQFVDNKEQELLQAGIPKEQIPMRIQSFLKSMQQQNAQPPQGQTQPQPNARRKQQRMINKGQNGPVGMPQR